MERPEEKPMIRVCLVDDQTLVRQGIRSLLALNDGIEVVAEASDGRQAVDLIPQVKPDVVLMDVAMPGMNGIEAADRIKKEMPHVRVVALSMHNMDDVRRRMLAAGADEYVRKTSSPERLLAAVRGPERR